MTGSSIDTGRTRIGSPVAGLGVGGPTRSPWVVLGLVVVTLGLYWIYAHYRMYQDLGAFVESVVTAHRPVVKPWVGLVCVIVFGAFASLALTSKIRQAQSLAGLKPKGSYLITFFFVGLSAAYQQHLLNRLWRDHGIHLENVAQHGRGYDRLAVAANS